MKRVSKLFYILIALVGVSCSSYLDINDVNPNQPTSASPNLVLNNALVATANVLNGFNTYGAQIGGYMANAGGYGGFNEFITYAYTPNSFNVWSGPYDNLEDYQYIINSVGAQMAKGDSTNVYFYAIAKTMRAHNFQLIVDTYNNAPYTEALKGADNLTPKYDDAATIYKSLGDELDEATRLFRRGDLMAIKNDLKDQNGNSTTQVWHQFANTLKLKLMVRASGKVTFTKTTFDNAGFVTGDVTVNPGYKRDNGKQNPLWNTWGFAYTLTSGNKAWIPTKYVMAFYDGTKLSDAGRGAAMYYQFPATGTNQLGIEGVGIPKCPSGSFWYPGADRSVAPGNSTGVLKDPAQSAVYMTAAESYLLQAEAVERGLITSTSTAAQLFDWGVRASFRYLYSNYTFTGYIGDPDGDWAAYKAFNNNYLVDYSLANTPDEKMEAIITQKWIAVNMINSNEGWNEYRRTGYPLSATVNWTATNSFASPNSVAPPANQDRLPVRIPYPVSESQYNPINLPTGINNFSSKIFWAK